ncbi:hypothetical protein [Bacillus taeanensis]|uniref:Uncharacterized protein n=1 Tax=Bacillus taeanensis TaxID=273032 RepID=A0A366XY66_9BACI|nr:hypothetical protein [Bacillus taeanensis]RBW69104.1 hypothetical protein DS031_13175 [Bacillus taeanensis]
MAKFTFHSFSIDNLSDSSGVFSGDNYQTNFSSIGKKNEGNGMINGDHNVLFNNKHVVMKRKNGQEKE